jgi:hypothetical protein
MPYTIQASKVNEYGIGPFATWTEGRNANKGSVLVNQNNANHRVTYNEDLGAPSPGQGQWTFTRTYIEFDLSSVIDPITSMTLFVKGFTVTGGTSYIAYGGQTALTDAGGDYSLYLANLSGTDYLATGPITLNYTSFPLDLTTYPPSDPPGYYVIGLIASVDFTNDVGGESQNVRIDNDTNIPYLIINQTGYPYEVSGVIGANITEVSGVPVASIVNIMGV